MANQYKTPYWDTLIQSYLGDLKAGNKSPATIDSYRDQLYPFFEFLQDRGKMKPIAQLGKHEVNTYLQYLQQKKTKHGKPLSPFTIQIFARTIKAFFSWLENDGYIATNPLLKFKLPKVPKLVISTLTMAEFTKLLAAIDVSQPNGVRDALILYLLLDTGIRVSELVGIKLTDINTISGDLMVTGKGNKQRYIPISGKTRKLLNAFITKGHSPSNSCDSPYLFCNHDGGHLLRNAIQQLIRRLSIKAGLDGKRIHPHLFRHTFATMSVANEANVIALKEIMGHASLQTTMKYTHLSDDDLKAQHAKFSPVAYLNIS